MRQALLAATTSDKSLAELQEIVAAQESQLPSLTKKQKNTIERWCSAVARINEKPFVEFYMLKCGPCQLLEFAESYFSSESGPVVSTEIQQQYYYEEKRDVLQNLIEHNLDYLQHYQDMMKNLRSYLGEEAKSSTWNRWDNDYAVRKLTRWIREWKGRYLP